MLPVSFFHFFFSKWNLHLHSHTSFSVCVRRPSTSALACLAAVEARSSSETLDRRDCSDARAYASKKAQESKNGSYVTNYKKTRQLRRKSIAFLLHLRTPIFSHQFVCTLNLVLLIITPPTMVGHRSIFAEKSKHMKLKATFITSTWVQGRCYLSFNPPTTHENKMQPNNN